MRKNPPEVYLTIIDNTTLQVWHKGRKAGRLIQGSTYEEIGILGTHIAESDRVLWIPVAECGKRRSERRLSAAVRVLTQKDTETGSADE
jgi:hypothetical protein